MVDEGEAAQDVWGVNPITEVSIYYSKLFY